MIALFLSVLILANLPPVQPLHPTLNSGNLVAAWPAPPNSMSTVQVRRGVSGFYLGSSTNGTFAQSGPRDAAQRVLPGDLVRVVVFDASGNVVGRYAGEVRYRLWMPVWAVP